MLGKQGLFGIRNSCILPVEDHQNIKLQLELVSDVLVVSLGLVKFRENSSSQW